VTAGIRAESLSQGAHLLDTGREGQEVQVSKSTALEVIDSCGCVALECMRGLEWPQRADHVVRQAQNHNLGVWGNPPDLHMNQCLRSTIAQVASSSQGDEKPVHHEGVLIGSCQSKQMAQTV
jgi:hypothetical protein